MKPPAWAGHSHVGLSKVPNTRSYLIVTRPPFLGPALQLCSRQGRGAGELPCPTGHPLLHAPRTPLAFVGHQGTLLVPEDLVVPQYPPGPSWSCPQAGQPHLCYCRRLFLPRGRALQLPWLNFMRFPLQLPCPWPALTAGHLKFSSSLKRDIPKLPQPLPAKPDPAAFWEDTTTPHSNLPSFCSISLRLFSCSASSCFFFCASGVCRDCRCKSKSLLTWSSLTTAARYC